MTFFDPKFVEANASKAQITGLFKTGELVWDEERQDYLLAGAACVSFMLYEAYANDPTLTPQQHEANRFSVGHGIALAVQAGFKDEPALLRLLKSANPNLHRLRKLSNQMLEHISVEDWLHAAFGFSRSGTNVVH